MQWVNESKYVVFYAIPVQYDPIKTSKCHRQRPPSLHKAQVEFEQLLVTVHVVNMTGLMVGINHVKMMGMVVVVNVMKVTGWVVVVNEEK